MANTYEAIASTTLASTATSITLSSIPSTYTDLRVVCYLTNTLSTNLRFTMNGLGGTGYGWELMSATSTTATSANGLSQANVTLNNGSIVASAPYLVTVDINSYNTTNTKMFLFSLSSNGTSATNSEVGRIEGHNGTSAAVSSITFAVSTGLFSVGSTISLYGIKAA